MIYLYVKTHKKTGLKYFGKTTRKDYEKYKGSGLYWKRHLIKYGNDIDTELVAIFDNEEECESFALIFSEEHNISHSDEWANLKYENGKDGNPKGIRFTEEHKEKIRQSRLGKCYNDFDIITRKKMSEAALHNVLKTIESGKHFFSGETGSIYASERNKELVKNGTHNFLGEKGSILAKNNTQKMIESDTHPFQGQRGRELIQKRIQEGTFVGFEKNLVSVVDKNGNHFKIEKELFWKQEGQKEDWEFVGASSKEAKKRLNTARRI